jgi:hypothetical protein
LKIGPASSNAIGLRVTRAVLKISGNMGTSFLEIARVQKKITPEPASAHTLRKLGKHIAK